ncbi:uncharacterized protein LOC127286311 [Leptopilina boulardi]|uniref:uncharacterized protein LOC127279248 n=1 Tax=Leptopilina boulardi TaxID=63433 RepID=UPI0021F67028|nr:uncharacterized protein LOC127279248 [Leptopilina boulardi]XP_051168653.1 uncharacterized protein LOC127286311 [Leptopilina boulardi]
MDEILNIPAAVNFDESIAHYEIHAHQPYASSSFNNSDEIRIAVQHQDLCILPSKSSLHVFGRLTRTDGITLTETVHLSSNAVCFLFDEIRYELNGIEIDRCKYVGHTTIMKNYVSVTPPQLNFIENAGFSKITADARITLENGYFDVTIPLGMIFGFAEDYKKIIINAKHELILTRARNDMNAIFQTGQGENEQFKISINKIEWMVPYVLPADNNKVKLLKFIEKDPLISMSFRSWEMYEYPLIPLSSKVMWQIKTSTQLEKPRYVIVGFQTARKDKQKKYACHFDHCNITNVKLFLNSQYYPYGNLNLNFDQNQYALLYEMYANFQTSYYGKDSKPLLTKDIFKSLFPLIVIDCSKQNEFLKQASVDVRLEFEAGINMPAETTAYCLIIHDRVVQYKPISGVVKKLL